MKYNDNGTYKDIYVKAFDTLPVGTEVDFNGSTVPSGWTEIPDPNEYSTTEKRIGTWINKKPLYRRVFTGTLSNGTQTVVATISNINIKNAYGNYIYSGNELFFGKSDNDTTLATRIQKTSANDIKIYHTTTISGSTYELVIEYTKTTD